MFGLSDPLGLFVQSEAELDGDLPIIHLAIFDVTAGLDDLEPMQIVQRLRRLRDRALDSIFDADFRGARQLDLFIDVFAHTNLRRP
jgi:hypothetical protein